MQMIILIGVLLVLSMRLTRCILFNLPYELYYMCKDTYDYFKLRKWTNFSEFGIDMFIGMFGKGKTLSMTHKARMLYQMYGDSIRFISNYELKGIPYTPLINFNQIVELEDKREEGIQGYVILIDEISSVLSHRNYAKFPLETLGVLCQQRKCHIYIMCTAQRFFMVDKIWRSITTNVYDCNKIWRFCHFSIYDAWDYENAMNVQLIKRLGHFWWFVRNRDFESYDTSQLISKESINEFISNEEAIIRKGLDSQVNEIAIQNPSRSLRKKRKKVG